MDQLTDDTIDRIIEMAWEDRTPFKAIFNQFDLSEGEVIKLMRRQLKPPSFKRWRSRVQARTTKHAGLRQRNISRFKSSRQRAISQNRIAKKK